MFSNTMCAFVANIVQHAIGRASFVFHFCNDFSIVYLFSFCPVRRASSIRSSGMNYWLDFIFAYFDFYCVAAAFFMFFIVPMDRTEKRNEKFKLMTVCTRAVHCACRLRLTTVNYVIYLNRFSGQPSFNPIIHTNIKRRRKHLFVGSTIHSPHNFVGNSLLIGAKSFRFVMWSIQQWHIKHYWNTNRPIALSMLNI